MPAAKPPVAAGPITIQRLGRTTMLVPIIGLTPLIQHNWADKARREMLEAQQGVKKVKQHRDPEAEFQSAHYRIDTDEWLRQNKTTVAERKRLAGTDMYGFPSLGFKSCLVSGARMFNKAVTMVQLNQGIYIDGIITKADIQRLVRIEGTPWLREDIVTIGMGSRDLRYRPQFDNWSATLSITYIDNVFAQETVLALLEAGGMTVGIGDWRPEKSGESGMFCIDATKDIVVANKVIKK